MAIKVSRKKSSDPKQEQLRQLKDDWNQSVSALIAILISLKRGINGRGDAKFNLPVSSIKDPIPEEIVSFLSGTEMKSKEIIDDAKNIVNKQKDFSETRKKALKEILLTKISSNIFTRFKSKLFNTPIAWWNNDKFLKLKLRTINILYKIEDELEAIDLELSSGSLTNTPLVILKFANVLALYRLTYLKTIEKLIEESSDSSNESKLIEVNDSEKPQLKIQEKPNLNDLEKEPEKQEEHENKIIDYDLPEGPTELTAEQQVQLTSINKLIKYILSDIEAILLFEDLFNDDIIKSVPSNFRKYNREVEKVKEQMKNGLKTFEEFKQFAEKNIIERYYKHIDLLKELTGETRTNKMSIKLIYDRYIERQKESGSNPNLEKSSSIKLVAKNNLKRNLYRWLYSWSFDELRTARIDISKKVDSLAKKINNTSNIFESRESTINDINQATKEINLDLANIASDFYQLASIYNLEAETSKFKGKPLKKIEEKILTSLLKSKEYLS